MSKLIKSQDNTEITSFGFQAIQKVRNEGVRRADKRNGQSTDDPFLDLENTIQQRLMDLERKAQEIEKEAYESGYSQGEKDGFEYGRKSLEVIKNQLEQLIGGLERLPAQIFRDYRDWLVSVGMGVARRIVRRELAVSRETVIETVEALMAEAEEHSSLTLYLSPRDLEFFEKKLALSFSSTGSRHFAVRPAADIEPGGCRLESDIQFLDATIETQFATVEQSLRESGLELENDPA